jgi:predicted nucleic acid-binding Zn ribbon protein
MMSKYRRDNRLVVEIVRRERRRQLKYALIYIAITAFSFIVGVMILGGN